MIEGTVIHGTLRPEDLIPAFWAALEDIAPETAYARLDGTYGEEINTANMGEEALERYREFYGQDAAQHLSEAIEMLMDDLSANAAPGYYFGTLEGDGSDFGFWPEVGGQP